MKIELMIISFILGYIAYEVKLRILQIINRNKMRKQLENLNEECSKN